MSIFNFRRGRTPAQKSSSKGASAQAAPESVEAVRKRARHRLIGSALLVLLGVVGFPLLFETQPRPVPVDIPIDIPSRQAVKPGSPVAPVLPAQRSVPVPPPEASAPTAPAAPEPAVSAQASLEPKEEIVEPRPAAEAKPAPQPAAPKPAVAQAVAKPEAAKPEPAKPEAPKPRPDDGQRAKALLDGASTPSSQEAPRVVVQVGAFSDANKAREVRAKLEKAGLKTYTQVAETKDGKRIRVRVGPYATKAEADKAVAKIKSLDLPAAILAL